MSRTLSTIPEPPTREQLLLRQLDAKGYKPTPDLARVLKHVDEAKRSKADTKSQNSPSIIDALEQFKRKNKELDRGVQMLSRTARKRKKIKEYDEKQKQKQRTEINKLGILYPGAEFSEEFGGGRGIKKTDISPYKTQTQTQQTQTSRRKHSRRKHSSSHKHSRHKSRGHKSRGRKSAEAKLIGVKFI